MPIGTDIAADATNFGTSNTNTAVNITASAVTAAETFLNIFFI